MNILDSLNLSMLSTHGWQILLSCISWNAVYYLVLFVSDKLRIRSYLKLSKKKKLDWAVTLVSLLHSSIIVFLALPMLFDKQLVQDKIFGYSEYGGSILAITTGYFLWDTILCLSSIQLHGYQFAFHAITCLIIFLLSFVSHCAFISRNQYLITLGQYFYFMKFQLLS